MELNHYKDFLSCQMKSYIQTFQNHYICVPEFCAIGFLEECDPVVCSSVDVHEVCNPDVSFCCSWCV